MVELTNLKVKKLDCNLNTAIAVKEIKPKNFEDVVNTPNKSYTISSKYDLNNKVIKLPNNVILKFSGNGQLVNGTIIGNNTTIVANYKIFTNIKVEGTFTCVGDIRWFAKGSVNDRIDEAKELQCALDSSFSELVFAPVPYYITETLILNNEKLLRLQGDSMKLSLAQNADAKNTSIIFSDKDITLLQICPKTNEQNSVTILGGNFDVSLCKNYTSDCIKITTDNNERIWGLTICTTVNNMYNCTTGVGININTVKNPNSVGYVTQVLINSMISNFGTGVCINNYMNEFNTNYYNWCTGVIIDGSIVNCPTAVYSNADCDIRALIQCGYFFDDFENNTPLIKFDGVNATISSNTYDFRLKYIDKYSNWTVLEVTNHNAVVVIEGMLKSWIKVTERLGKPSIVKGVIY